MRISQVFRLDFSFARLRLPGKHFLVAVRLDRALVPLADGGQVRSLNGPKDETERQS